MTAILRLERDGMRVRLITSGGHDWTARYPWILEAARKVCQTRFVLDGEAVVLGVDGVSDFNALHSRKHDYEVRFCAFDVMLDGDDDLREARLDRLFARRRPYQAGRSRHWIKVKKRTHPATDRVMEAFR